jgi:hypothetical protein
MYPLNVQAMGLIFFNQLVDELGGIICRIIQNLNLKAIGWIIQSGDSVQ